MEKLYILHVQIILIILLLIGRTGRDLVFYSIDYLGNIIWRNTFGNENIEDPVIIQKTNDNNL